jgi:hypothetical protein
MKIRNIILFIAMPVLLMGLILLVSSCIHKKRSVDSYPDKKASTDSYPQIADSFGLSMSLSGQPILGSHLNLVVTVKPNLSLREVNIIFFLPEQVTLADGSRRCKADFGDLTQGERTSWSIPLRVDRIGDWFIEAYASGKPTPEANLTRSYFLFGRTTETSGEILQRPATAAGTTEQTPTPIETSKPVQSCPKS